MTTSGAIYERAVVSTYGNSRTFELWRARRVPDDDSICVAYVWWIGSLEHHVEPVASGLNESEAKQLIDLLISARARRPNCEILEQIP